MNDHPDLYGIFRTDVFDGQVAIVTGGGTGIGREVAMLLARLGAKVLICGRRMEPLKTTVADILSEGGEAFAVATDIRDGDAAAATIGTAWDRWKRLDILINNAGGQFVQQAIDISPKGWRAVIDTNLNGTWNMMQAAALQWRQRGHPGSVVNVILAVSRGIPGMAHSVAARGGILHLSKTVAVEWAPLSIRVNCVAPGIINSTGLANYDADVRQRSLNSNPMHRLGTPFEVAQICAYISSPAAAFMTGEVVTVDGGQHLWGETWTIPAPDRVQDASN